MVKTSGCFTRKVLAVVASVVLVVGLMPLPALAVVDDGTATAPEVATQLAAGTASALGIEEMPLAVGALTEGAAESEYSWDSLQNDVNTAKNGDTITLPHDVTAGSSNTRIQIPKNKTITIDLAGYTLNRNLGSETSQTTGGNVIEVLEGATLTITDSSAGKTGRITGGYPKEGGGIHVKKNATLNFQGGTIVANRASVDGAGIYVSGALHMTGGIIDGNYAAKSGGGIFADADSTIELSNVTITNSKAL